MSRADELFSVTFEEIGISLSLNKDDEQRLIKKDKLNDNLVVLGIAAAIYDTNRTKALVVRMSAF